MSLHLGIWLTLGMGDFPAIAGGCMVCFLPSWFWSRAEARWRPPTWLRSVRRERAAPSDSKPTVLRTPRPVNVLAAALLAFVLLWNITTVSALRLPPAATNAGVMLGLSQRWDMFAPSPLRWDGWYVVPATLRSGQSVDLAGVLRDDNRIRPLSWRTPRDIHSTYKNEHWRKYLENLRSFYVGQNLYLSQYLCREWNTHHSPSESVTQLSIVYMNYRALPDNKRGPTTLTTLWTHSCA